MKKKYKKYNGKIVISLIEPVLVRGKNNKKKEVMAKIDTGATKSSIDTNLASEIGLGPIIETKLGKARITSRPGQTGAINAVLLS